MIRQLQINNTTTSTALLLVIYHQQTGVPLSKDTSSTSSFVFDQVSIDFLDTFIMAHGHVEIEDGQEKKKIRQSQDDLIGPQPACFINRLALFFNLISLLTTVLCHLLR